jgi:hypothetical protein
VKDYEESEPREKAGAVERDLHAALLTLLRHMRAARRTEREWLEPLVGSLYESLSRILAEHDAIHLRVGPDGFFHGPHRVLEYSPREDASVFQLFQHGVMQITFSSGLTREEVHELLDVLSTDLGALEEQEEDVTTLLLGKELASISLVVIETFSEAGAAEEDPRTRARGVEVATLVSDALRRTLSQAGEIEAGEARGSIRFWQADVKFLEQTDLPKILASLPRVASGADVASRALDDPEIAALAAELRDSLDRSGRSLATAALAAIEGADTTVGERLSGLLASEILREARRSGLATSVPAIIETLSWAGAGSRGSIGRRVLADLWASDLVSLVVKASLADATEDREVALALLATLPVEQTAHALKLVARAPSGQRRTDAIGALVSGGRALGAATSALPSLDPDAQLAVLQAARATNSDAATLGLFRAGLSVGDVKARVQALAWFARRGGDHAIGTLGQALRDRNPQLRAAALLLSARSGARAARSVIKVWFDEPAFDDLPLEEKRKGALVLARLAGSVVREPMRELAMQTNLMMRQKTDERRAVAVAALGLLVDAESLDALKRMVDARTTGPALKSELAHVVAAISEGRAAYADPVAALEQTLRETDLGPCLDADRAVVPVLAPLVPTPPKLDRTSLTQGGAIARTSVTSFPPPRRSVVPGDRPSSSGFPAPDPADVLASYSFDDLGPLVRRRWGERERR